MNLSKDESSCLIEMLELRFTQLNTLLQRSDVSPSEQSSYKQTIKLLASIKDKVISCEQPIMSEQAGLPVNAGRFGDYRVLIVDDNASIRQYMILMLKNNGFRHFEEANDAHNALAKNKG